MAWLRRALASPLNSFAFFVALLAALGAGFFALLVVWGFAGVFGALGAIIVGVVVWDLVWARPRWRARQRAVCDAAQRSPDDLSLRSGQGEPHWSDQLPEPLASITLSTPVALATIAIVGGACILITILAALATTGNEEHVSLARGSYGYLDPTQAGNVKVTILEIEDAFFPGEGNRAPTPGKKYWAAYIDLHNTASTEVASLSWMLRDSLGTEHERTLINDPDWDLPDRGLARDEKMLGWIAFEIDGDAHPVWLHVSFTGWRRFVDPDGLYFRAGENVPATLP